MDVPVLVVGLGALLVAAVLVSELANRTVLSTAVLFLAGGFLLGPGVSDVLHVESGDPGVTILAELALFSVLYSDGMRVSLPDLRRAYGLPPYMYLEQLRIERARVLLRAGTPTSHVAYETGFSDQSHLTRRFKRVVGVPPGQYARSHVGVAVAGTRKVA